MHSGSCHDILTVDSYGHPQVRGTEVGPCLTSPPHYVTLVPLASYILFQSFTQYCKEEYSVKLACFLRSEVRRLFI